MIDQSLVIISTRSAPPTAPVFTPIIFTTELTFLLQPWTPQFTLVNLHCLPWSTWLCI